MTRLKTLGVLGGIIAALAISATPSYAIFKSNNGTSHGIGHVITSGEFKYISGGALQGTVTCEPKGIAAEWSIQTKGQIKQHEQAGKQEPTTEGPHLYIKVTKWGTCEAKISGSPLPAEVKPCSFQLVQPQKGSPTSTATAGIATSCLIKAGSATKPTCEIQVPAGMEKQPGSDSGINVGLTATTLENTAVKNLLGESNITGGGQGQLGKLAKAIYAQSLAGHTLCTLSPVTEEATLVGLKVEGEELSLA